MALGGAFLLEGAVWALFPDAMKKAMYQLQSLPEHVLRTGGLILAGIGTGIVVWFLR